jgi:hypothetical protein
VSTEGNSSRSVKLFIERRLRLLAKPGQQWPADPITFGHLADRPAVVLLGDPGAGKSTLFQHEAQRWPGSRCLPVRRFLNLPLAELQAPMLFLDGLDEARSGGSDPRDALDLVIRRLIELGRPRFRLSCRASDWLGHIDREALADAAREEVVQAELLPLSSEEVNAIVRSRLADPEAFLQTVRRQGMAGWLGNPQTLELMIAAAEDGPLPETRHDLFERACMAMAREVNRHHVVASGTPDVESTLDLAGYLSALLLLAGLEGFASDPGEADPDFPALEDVGWPSHELRPVVGTRLFSWDGGETRVRPLHRTIAEYLAARHLVKRIRGGLPVHRIVCRLTGHDGGTLSDLRGLYAWLATLAPDHAELLAHADPLALVLYGDPAALPVSLKRAILSEIQAWGGNRDPLFLLEVPSLAFGSLADPALVPELRAILSDPARPPQQVLTVLEILAYGSPLCDLAPDLARLVHSERPIGIRQTAVLALASGIGSEAELLGLLDELQAGRLEDTDDELRGELLERLYLKPLSPRVMLTYVKPRKAPDHHSALHRFIASLARRTDDAALPELLDALAEMQLWNPPPARISVAQLGFSWGLVIGSLQRRGIELHGETVAPHRLWSWLRAGAGPHGEDRVDARDKQAIAAWFAAHPGRLAELYERWMISTATSEPIRGEFEFWRVTRATAPPGFWRAQLALAAARMGEPLGKEFFRGAWRSLARSDPSAIEVGQLWDWIDRHPDFSAEVERLRVSELDESLLALSVAKGEKPDEAAARATKRALIAGRLDGVRTADDRELLAHLASIFLDPTDRGGGVGLNRIVHEYGTEIAAAAEEGFIAALSRTDLPTPAEIGATAAEDKFHPICLGLVAGVELLHARGAGPRLYDSPGARAALAFDITAGVYQTDAWSAEAIRQEPAAAAAVVLQAWTPFLDRGSADVPHLERLGVRAAWLPLARELGLTLLARYPRANAKRLAAFMGAALVGARRDELASLARREIPCLAGLDVRQSTLWLALGLLMAPGATLRRARSYLRSERVQRAYRLAESLQELSHRGESFFQEMQSAALAEIVALLATTCKPEPLPPHGGSGRHDPIESARFVSHLIGLLAGRTEDPAVTSLQRLSRRSGLTAWRDQLLTHAERQRRKVREERHVKLPLAEIVRILAGGPPATAADLKVLAADHFRGLAEVMRHAAGDAYATFWNVDHRGNPVNPVPENVARNRLLLLLRPLLAPLGVSAEPEAQYADETRSDFKLIHRLISVPVEVKRSDHRELWTAPQTQLKKKYMIDPACKGHGIFWCCGWVSSLVAHRRRRRVPSRPHEALASSKRRCGICTAVSNGKESSSSASTARAAGGRLAGGGRG